MVSGRWEELFQGNEQNLRLPEQVRSGFSCRATASLPNTIRHRNNQTRRKSEPFQTHNDTTPEPLQNHSPRAKTTPEQLQNPSCHTTTPEPLQNHSLHAKTTPE